MSKLIGEIDKAKAQQAFAQGDLITAYQLLTRFVKKHRHDVAALQLLGRVESQRGRFDDATNCFKQCLKLQPRDGGTYFAMAECAYMKGDAERAIEYLKEALRINPESELAKIELAKVHERRGHYDEAAILLEAIPEHSRFWANRDHVLTLLALHQKDFAGAVQASDRVAGDTTVRAQQRSEVLILRGQAFDKLGEEDRAMEAWHLANSLVQKPFDPETYSREVDATIAFFAKNRLADLPRAHNESELPMFIAGMPRSGTTLVEQIIDAHPQGFGAGELTDIDVLPNQFVSDFKSMHVYPDLLARVAPKQLDRRANEYLASLSKMRPRGATRVVNKSLDNYKLLGLIWMLFPKARVVYCRRNPIDTCLSIYMNMFSPHKHMYKADLRQLGLVYRESLRLMAHWKEALDLPILEVEYEDLVANQEARTRDIIDHCGLDWDDACLRFHKSGRTVMTLSYQQVSQPIYTSAVKRYERYRQHLGPLIDALGTDGEL